MLNISATADVPPSASITSESVMWLSPIDVEILGAPNFKVKARLTDNWLPLLNMETWHDRLNKALKDTGETKAALAKRIGVSAPTVTDWTKGNIRTISADNAERLCRHLGIRTSWLLTGKGDMRPPGSVKDAGAAIANMSFSIPLLSWDRAKEWCQNPVKRITVEDEEMLPAQKNAGSRSFALKVSNDSMTSPYPGQRSYLPGTILYIDPDKEAVSGCRVIALAGGECTFKTYVEDAGRKYLKPINPSYDKIDITQEVRICGVVIGSYLPE